MNISKVFRAAALLALMISSYAVAGMLTVTDPGDAGSGVCGATCTLRDAIASVGSSDTLVFDPTLASPITLAQGALVLDKALTIQGPGAAKLTVSANNASQVLVVSAQVSISGLTLADGFIGGTAGSNGAGGSGATGSPGGPAGGACVQIANSGTLVLDDVSVRHCLAYGGSGGNGGSGAPGNPFPPPGLPGGFGGNGAPGGAASGGAILVLGSLSLLNSSVVDGQAYGGAGGSGGSGGPSTIMQGGGGSGGSGGAANGGAIFAAAGASLRVSNSTIAASSGIGGNGGALGGGTFPAPGGFGGAASGGLIRVDNAAALADIEFSTLTSGQVTGGTAGAGIGGGPGSAAGNAISAASTTTALSSVVVDVQSGVSLCDGQVAVASGSVNLAEDATNCSGFTLQGTFAQLFHPLDVTTTPWPGYLPLYHSVVIDAAATCQDLAAQTVASDQHDTLRPQGAGCDLGAIEADYIFVDGFE